MNIDKIKNSNANRAPILGFLHCIRPSAFREFLISLSNKSGLVIDYFGVEYEENNTLTFFDFTSFDVDLEVNVSLQEFIEIIHPIIEDYLDEYPKEEQEIKKILLELRKICY
ncbi:hypothetical protein ACI75Y_05250 [Capnocytophaga stomatis]|uniref:hypothetical protein n=1 Tax=Capnocytophaga stomatis TaxID=1848904 RepID=UPI00385A744F